MKKTNKIALLDYEKWVEANPKNKFSLYDYIHGIFRQKNLEIDLVYALIKLLWPDFIKYQDYIFLKEEFDENKFRNLISQGCKNKDLEFWMNIINLDGMFETTNKDICIKIGNIIAALWRTKLKNEFKGIDFCVKCINEKKEIYVYFNQESTE